MSVNVARDGTYAENNTFIKYVIVKVTISKNIIRLHKK
jgi:hypothetical protein